MNLMWRGNLKAAEWIRSVKSGKRKTITKKTEKYDTSYHSEKCGVGKTSMTRRKGKGNRGKEIRRKGNRQWGGIGGMEARSDERTNTSRK